MRQLSRNSKGQFEPTHGLGKTILRQTHANMMGRCYSPKCKSYIAYGDKGVKVYKEWHDLKTFYNYCIDNGWFKGCNISRKGDIGNYEPNNVRFITPQENRLEAGMRTGRKIRCINNGKTFYSVKEAARWVNGKGLSNGKIKTIAENIRCKGLKGSTSYGFKWEVILNEIQ